MTNKSRRNFLKSAGVVTAGAALAPGLLSCTPKKVKVAFIGIGNRGMYNIKACLEENIVALCDADDNMGAAAYNRFPEARRFKDFRRMFKEMGNEIEAVFISTPDHTHFASAMAAMEIGIPVYVEKPLAHNVWQLRTLKKAAKKYNVITQMGNQGHATDGIRRIKEWYDAGVTGEITEILAWFNGPAFGENKYFTKPSQWPPIAEQIPTGLDWNLWQGPTKRRNFNHTYVPKSWRGYYDYGNAELGDWACHTLDAPFWTLGLGMPAAAECLFNSGAPEGYVPDQSIIKFEFPARGNKPAVNLTWYEGGLKPEMRPEMNIEEFGSNGMLMLGEKHNIITGGRPDYPSLTLPKEEMEKWVENEMPKPTIPRVNGGPQKEFLDAVKGIGPMPGSNFEYAADLTEMALIGVLAQRLNTRIEYDAKNMKVINHDGMDKYLKEPAHKGWDYGEDLI